MSEDPIEALDQVIWKILVSAGEIKGNAESGWLEKAKFSETRRWLVQNIAARLQIIKRDLDSLLSEEIKKTGKRDYDLCMGWMEFADKVAREASRLTSSNIPILLVMPDGREISFEDVDVSLFEYKGHYHDSEFDTYGMRAKLIGVMETEAEDAKKDNA